MGRHEYAYECDQTSPFFACCVVIACLLCGPLGVVVVLMVLMCIGGGSMGCIECCAGECNSNDDSDSVVSD